MTSCLLITGYNCNLVSFLTLPVFERPTNTLEELLESDLHWGTSFDFWTPLFRESSNPVVQMISKKRIDTNDPLQLRILVRQRKLAVPVEYYRPGSLFSADFLQTNSLKQFISMGENVMSQPVAFIFHKHSPLVELFNPHLIRIIESGIIGQWEMELVNLMDTGLNRGSAEIIRPLKFIDVAGSYMLLALGVIISTAVFLIEIFVKQYSRLN